MTGNLFKGIRFSDRQAPFVFCVNGLGLLSLRYPRFTLSFVVFSTIMCAIFSTLWLSFEAEPSKVFEGGSKEYQLLQDFEQKFHTYSKDEILVTENLNLATVEGIERLREIHLDIQLTPGIGEVVSIFSIAEYSIKAKQWSTVLPSSFETQEQVENALENLYAENAISRSLITRNLDAAAIILSPDKAYLKSGEFKQSYDIDELQKTLSSYRISGLKIELAGESVIERELISLVKRDVVIISLLGILLAMCIAYFLFASVSAVLVCVFPLVVAIIWYLGAISIFGIPIDVVTIVIPILIIILSFADMVHLYLNWRRKFFSGLKVKCAIEDSVISIGPAIALASITTGIAFLVLMIASSTLLDRMAISGLLGVLMIFLSVIIIGPLAILFITPSQEVKISKHENLLNLGSTIAAVFYKRRPQWAIKAALVALVPLLWVHFQMTSHFSLLDYIPKTSVAHTADQKIEKLFGGSDQLILLVQRQSPETNFSNAEFENLRLLQKLTNEALGTKSAISIASIQSAKPHDSIGFHLDALPTSNLLQRFISNDLERFAITAPISISVDASTLSDQIRNLRASIRIYSPDSEIEITGSSHMKSSVGPRLIEELRLGLLLSVVISMFLIGASFRSWKIGIACLVPNVLPILTIEFLVWLMAGKLDLTLTIALMVGFGLAVDDTIHFLNHYVMEKEKSANEEEISVRTLKTVGPALMATTIIIGLGFSTTVFASLPTVINFALAIVGVLNFALIADIVVLPSALFALDQIHKHGIQSFFRKTSG